MWGNPISQEIFAKLQKHGYQFIGPDAGWLACRNVGAGRMAESANILQEVVRLVQATAIKENVQAPTTNKAPMTND
jgi:phosphopantothenoylcysteine decarboxylase/phosphopantothenate--cysteine ligase